MIYFQLEAPHLATNQGPQSFNRRLAELQSAFGGAASSDAGRRQVQPWSTRAAYTGEGGCNQLRPSTTELQPCTLKLQPAFGGATRLEVEMRLFCWNRSFGFARTEIPTCSVLVLLEPEFDFAGTVVVQVNDGGEPEMAPPCYDGLRDLMDRLLFRVASGKTWCWNDDEMRRACNDCYFKLRREAGSCGRR